MKNIKGLKQTIWTLLLLVALYGVIFIFEKGEELGQLLAYHY
ncbi:hypothetical protein [Elizabethkingia anophelis]|nr:hypothetical protein [Elizabethkingia anophelis]MCW2462878.1 hypothetical protein [Elizabethkingia anophelis]MCW2466563.1 hypothetical protein [Elizabethkingia anophelis]MCW2470247.1 hypothetical protein [Elizabethkingia anophelis]